MSDIFSKYSLGIDSISPDTLYEEPSTNIIQLGLGAPYPFMNTLTGEYLDENKNVIAHVASDAEAQEMMTVHRTNWLTETATETSADTGSGIFSKYALDIEDTPTDTVLNRAIQRTEAETPTPLTSIPTGISYSGVSQETERNFSIMNRVWRNFIEGAVPIPVDMDVPEAANRMELIADVIGSLVLV